MSNLTSPSVDSHLLSDNSREKKIKELMDNAKVLAKAGQKDELMDIFEEALSISPCDIKVLKRYARFLIDSDHSSKVNIIFEDCLRLNSDNIELILEYTKILIELSETKKASYWLDIGLNLESKNIEVLNSFAIILLKQGNAQKSYELFEKCLQLDLENLMTINKYTDALLRHGLYKRAIKVLENSIILLQQKNFKSTESCVRIISNFATYECNFNNEEKQKIESIFSSLFAYPFGFIKKKIILSYFIKSIRAGSSYTSLLKRIIALWLNLDPQNSKVLHSYLLDVFQADKQDKEKYYEVYKFWLDLEPKNLQVRWNYELGLMSINSQHTDVTERIFHLLKETHNSEENYAINKNDLVALINCHVDLLFKRSDNKKALFLLEITLQLAPHNVITLNSYANALLKNREYTKACQVLEKSLQLDDKYIPTLNSYANALLKNREYTRACQVLEKSLQINPQNIITLNSYANALLKNGEYTRACQILEESLQLDDKHIPTLNSYANALLKNGEYTRACGLFEKSLQLNGKHIPTLNSYVNALLKNREYERMYRFFKQFLHLDTKHILTLNSCANILFKNGEDKKACGLFEQSLQLDTNDVRTITEYAHILMKLKLSEKASVLFAQAIQLEPDNSILLTGYANALTYQGTSEKAIEYYERALKVNLNDVITLNCYANTLILIKQYDRALELLEQALKLNNDDVHTINNYTQILIQKEEFKRLVEFNPNHSYGRLQYAKQLESQGSYQEAISQLLTINLNSQKNYHANIIRLHLGRLYYRLNQPKIGKQYFEEAIAYSSEEEKDQSLLYAARSLLAVSPHSEEAVSWLQQIEESSLRYEEAMKAIALNADPETAYGLFAESEESFGDAEMLYRSIYHKIGNEVAILKSIAQRLLRKIAGEHPIVAEIVQDLDDLQESVTRQRTIEKAKIAAIPRQDYPQLIEIVSQTAHNISDEVNNILAAIESKTRRALRKLKIEDPLQENFQKLLLQLELTQTALNDLKSINEGIAIRRHRFPVRKLFEKWQPENWSNTPRIQRARIQLKIENPDSEFDGDEEKIKSILNELVENSRKHNYKHPDLLIRIVSNDLLNPMDIAMPTIPGDRKYLYLQVIDNGKGVPDDKKDWIFQPLNTTSPEDKGSGLGLFIARKTLQKMRGYIREVGEFGKGARFQIYIPYLSSQEF